MEAAWDPEAKQNISLDLVKLFVQHTQNASEEWYILSILSQKLEHDNVATEGWRVISGPVGSSQVKEIFGSIPGKMD